LILNLFFCDNTGMYKKKGRPGRPKKNKEEAAAAAKKTQAEIKEKNVPDIGKSAITIKTMYDY